jgi:toxin ParE1/3/4
VLRLRFSTAAKDDLNSIAEYIADTSGNRDVAERFTSELRQKCSDLAAQPIRIGRPRPELMVELRSFPFKGYMIFFRYIGDTFEVVNILEGHRDIAAFFRHE